MAKRPIIITENWGGQAPDLKQGPAHSFAYSRHLDFRKSPTTVSLLPRATSFGDGEEIHGWNLPTIAENVASPAGNTDWSELTEVYSVGYYSSLGRKAITSGSPSAIPGFAQADGASSPGVTNYLVARGYNFNVPDIATIVGIEVRVMNVGSVTEGNTEYSIRLYDGGVIGDDKANDQPILLFSNVSLASDSWTMEYGGATDVWGTSLTPADVNSDDFGIAIAYQNDGSIDPPIFLDTVQIKIYIEFPPSGSIDELMTDMTRLPSGKLVAIGHDGGVFVRATDGTWTKEVTTLPNTAYGMIYHRQHDTIYVPGTYSIHSITNADGRFGGTLTVNSNAITAQVDQSATNSTNSYNANATIDEGATHKLSVTPTIEPLYSLKLWVKAKGTGNLTVTMHDAANNTLGTATIANASITSNALNEFVFTTPVGMSVRPNAATYHFHVTFSGGTTSPIGAATSSDLSTARFETYSHRLTGPTNGFHPAYQFLQYLLILNGRYVAAWEPISQSAPSANEFLQHRLAFPDGYEATSGATWTEYFAIGIEKRSADSSNEYQDGKIIFWDGISTTYNFVIDVPEGSPYGLHSHKNVLYYFAGGGWYAYSGGNPVKIFQLPNTDSEFTGQSLQVINYPHTTAIRNNILMGAYPSETTSNSIEFGVYSYGSRDYSYNPSFGYSYTMSSGSRTNGSLQIGLLKSFGDRMFMSWRDGTSYGIDNVSPSSLPASEGVWESLIYDGGRPDKDKSLTEIKVNFKSLPTGATVTPKYSINRGIWVDGETVSSGTEATINVNTRFKELQVGYALTATQESPEITSVTFIVEELSSEAD